MSKSVRRVEQALDAAGVDAAVKRMPASTRTAAEAAAACDCSEAQIVKSLVFQGADSGEIKLLLAPGDRQVDLAKAAAVVGEPLGRADPKDVRRITGFAIGGVSPIGHLSPPAIWMDERLLAHDTVWAAAGAPDAVFQIAPDALRQISASTVADIT